MCLDVVLCMLGCLMLVLDKSPRLIVRGVIWILAFDNVFVNSTNISTNIETAVLSKVITHLFVHYVSGVPRLLTGLESGSKRKDRGSQEK